PPRVELLSNSGVAKPAQHFREGGALAIHQDANAVETRGEPEDTPNREYEEDYRESNLPERNHGHAHPRDHGIGRGEWEDRCSNAPSGIGVVEHYRKKSHACVERNDGHPHELLQVLCGFAGSRETRKDGAEESESQHKIDGKEDALGPGEVD